MATAFSIVFGRLYQRGWHGFSVLGRAIRHLLVSTPTTSVFGLILSKSFLHLGSKRCQHPPFPQWPLHIGNDCQKLGSTLPTLSTKDIDLRLSNLSTLNSASYIGTAECAFPAVCARQLVFKNTSVNCEGCRPSAR